MVVLKQAAVNKVKQATLALQVEGDLGDEAAVLRVGRERDERKKERGEQRGGGQLLVKKGITNNRAKTGTEHEMTNKDGHQQTMR